MLDQFRTEPPPPLGDMTELRRYSEQRGRRLRRRARRTRAGLIGAGCAAAVAAIVLPLTSMSSGTSRRDLALSNPAAPTPEPCTSVDAAAHRTAAMPNPQRAAGPVTLGTDHSPDLLPAPAGTAPKVPARSAWAAAGLPTGGGGHAAIVFGIYPTAPLGTAPSTPVWLVYAAHVALTDGYPTGGPPLVGVRGVCQFGYVDAVVDATTGAVLQRGDGLY